MANKVKETMPYIDFPKRNEITPTGCGPENVDMKQNLLGVVIGQHATAVGIP